MRYRVGEDPATSAAGAGTEAVLVFTLIISIVFGVILTWLGIKGKQTWLAIWSVGLIVVSIITWVWLYLD